MRRHHIGNGRVAADQALPQGRRQHRGAGGRSARDHAQRRHGRHAHGAGDDQIDGGGLLLRRYRRQHVRQQAPRILQRDPKLALRAGGGRAAAREQVRSDFQAGSLQRRGARVRAVAVRADPALHAKREVRAKRHHRQPRSSASSLHDDALRALIGAARREQARVLERAEEARQESARGAEGSVEALLRNRGRVGGHHERRPDVPGGVDDLHRDAAQREQADQRGRHLQHVQNAARDHQERGHEGRVEERSRQLRALLHHAASLRVRSRAQPLAAPRIREGRLLLRIRPVRVHQGRHEGAVGVLEDRQGRRLRDARRGSQAREHAAARADPREHESARRALRRRRPEDHRAEHRRRDRLERPSDGSRANARGVDGRFRRRTDRRR